MGGSWGVQREEGGIYEWKCTAKQSSKKSQRNVKGTKAAAVRRSLPDIQWLLFIQLLPSLWPLNFLVLHAFVRGTQDALRVLDRPHAWCTCLAFISREEQVGERQLESTCCRVNSYLYAGFRRTITTPIVFPPRSYSFSSFKIDFSINILDIEGRKDWVWETLTVDSTWKPTYITTCSLFQWILCVTGQLTKTSQVTRCDRNL